MEKIKRESDSTYMMGSVFFWRYMEQIADLHLLQCKCKDHDIQNCNLICWHIFCVSLQGMCIYHLELIFWGQYDGSDFK